MEGVAWKAGFVGEEGPLGVFGLDGDGYVFDLELGRRNVKLDGSVDNSFGRKEDGEGSEAGKVS